MFGDFEPSDLRTILLVVAVIIGILIVWAVVSSFVSVISGLIIQEDKKTYNLMMQSFKERFIDILSNNNYTEVKKTYLMNGLSVDLEKVNAKTSKKYLGAVIKEVAKLHNIETFPGDLPNNVYLKLPTGDEGFIWCVFSDTKSRYINFDKGEGVEIDGVVDRVNLVPSTLPSSLNDNLDKYFHADFAIHLQDNAKMRKPKIS